MIKDIKLIQTREMLCEEAMLATISIYFKKQYEMIFSQMWNFQLRERNAYDSKIGDLMIINIGEKTKLLEIYHGIKIESFDLYDSSKILAFIKQMVHQEYPICTYIKDYYIPWSKEANKNSYFPFIIVGIDNNSIYCIDIHFTKKIVTFILKDFVQYCKHLITFTKITEEEKYIDWREIITYNTNELLKKNAFNSMKDLSRFINSGFNYKNEINGDDKEAEPTICSKFKLLCRTRFLFSTTIKYLIDFHMASIPLCYVDSFIKISNHWLSIWGISTKAFYLAANTFPAEKISKKIIEVAELEESICDELIKITKGENILRRNAYVLHNEEKQKKEYVYVDISKCFNNEGFATKMDPKSTADLTGHAQFLLAGDLYKDRVWKINDLQFQLTYPEDGAKDNISCIGQKIPLPIDFYSSIIFIGCAEWGHQTDKIEIHYEENYVELPFELSDLSADPPIFGEQIVWKGKCAERVNGKVSYNPWFDYAYLFAQSIKIDKTKRISSIKLPDCSNIHIFAISLEK